MNLRLKFKQSFIIETILKRQTFLFINKWLKVENKIFQYFKILKRFKNFNFKICKICEDIN